MDDFSCKWEWKKTIKKPYKAYLTIIDIGVEVYNEIYGKTEISTEDRHILVETDVGESYLIDENFAERNFSISISEIKNRTIVYAKPNNNETRMSVMVSKNFLENYNIPLNLNASVGDYFMKINDGEIFVVSKKVFSYFYQII